MINNLIVSKKILYGICWIGNGHVFRQLPILDILVKTNTVVVFAYGNSYDFLVQYYKDIKNIHITKVIVPFYAWTENGLDFSHAVSLGVEKYSDIVQINSEAIEYAKNIIWKPDFVVSDYEPISAQYAYIYDVPFFTIDQQSKYLLDTFPASIKWHTCLDERMRLRLFFPTATIRFVTSFFPVMWNSDNIFLTWPILRDNILQLKKDISYTNTIVVYISSFHWLSQSYNDLATIFEEFPQIIFHVFAPETISIESKNIVWHVYWDVKYYSLLQNCMWIISTAWHSLLSEAVYLDKPVYTIPMQTYEQYMNAKMIEDNKWWVSFDDIAKDHLEFFLRFIETYDPGSKVQYNQNAIELILSKVSQII